MTALPDPVWPVVVLASIQIGDAALCIKPVACIAACFAAVQWPRRLWWSMPPLQRAAATGLVAGLCDPLPRCSNLRRARGVFLRGHSDARPRPRRREESCRQRDREALDLPGRRSGVLRRLVSHLGVPKTRLSCDT